MRALEKMSEHAHLQARLALSQRHLSSFQFTKQPAPGAPYWPCVTVQTPRPERHQATTLQHRLPVSPEGAAPRQEPEVRPSPPASRPCYFRPWETNEDKKPESEYYSWFHFIYIKRQIIHLYKQLYCYYQICHDFLSTTWYRDLFTSSSIEPTLLLWYFYIDFRILSGNVIINPF